MKIASVINALMEKHHGFMKSITRRGRAKDSLSCAVEFALSTLYAGVLRIADGDAAKRTKKKKKRSIVSGVTLSLVNVL